MPKNPTRRQLIAWIIQSKEGGLLRNDFSASCPKRGGPDEPNPEYPGKVGFPGGKGFSTCNGCKYFHGTEFNNIICTHSGANQAASRALAEGIRAWREERQSPRLL